MKTIAQQLNIKSFPFEIHNTNGNKVYYENLTGEWYKSEWDTNGKEVYCESSNGYWVKNEYDTNGNQVYHEDSNGEWYKKEYDTNGKEIYFEDSYGTIINNRPKPMKEFSPFEIRDAKGNIIYIENSKGFWEKREYDTNSKEVYFENSIGIIEDNRTKPVKEYSMDEIANKLGIPVEQLKIKK